MELANQNEDANFVLSFTEPMTRELRNEVPHFLLTNARITWSEKFPIKFSH